MMGVLAWIGSDPQQQRSPERIMDARKMISARQGLKRLAGTIGFVSVAVLLNALVCSNPAAAQCGASGVGGVNTACGIRALQSNTTGVANNAFGYNALHYNTTGSYNTA